MFKATKVLPVQYRGEQQKSPCSQRDGGASKGTLRCTDGGRNEHAEEKVTKPDQTERNHKGSAWCPMANATVTEHNCGALGCDTLRTIQRETTGEYSCGDCPTAYTVMDIARREAKGRVQFALY